MQETQVWALGREDPLELEMATHSNILAWKISWTQDPGGLQFMGSQRVRHYWAHTEIKSDVLGFLFVSLFFRYFNCNKPALSCLWAFAYAFLPPRTHFTLLFASLTPTRSEDFNSFPQESLPGSCSGTEPHERLSWHHYLLHWQLVIQNNVFQALITRRKMTSPFGNMQNSNMWKLISLVCTELFFWQSSTLTTT